MNNTIKKLIEDGWKEFPDSFKENKICLAKSVDGHAECLCNDGKHKQVEIYKYNTKFGGFEGGYEVVVCGELPDGEWVKLISYGLKPDTTFENLKYKAEEMLCTWDFIHNYNKEHI